MTTCAGGRTGRHPSQPQAASCKLQAASCKLQAASSPAEYTAALKAEVRLTEKMMVAAKLQPQ